jgi:hypothetical protein
LLEGEIKQSIEIDGGAAVAGKGKCEEKNKKADTCAEAGSEFF